MRIVELVFGLWTVRGFHVIRTSLTHVFKGGSAKYIGRRVSFSISDDDTLEGNGRGSRGKNIR
jgi:hypothetical protein